MIEHLTTNNITENAVLVGLITPQQNDGNDLNAY